VFDSTEPNCLHLTGSLPKLGTREKPLKLDKT